MLSARGLSFSYRSERVFTRVDLDVARGELLGLHGPSGSGKTTLGKLLAGWLTPTAGQVRIDGAAPPRRGFHPVQLIAQHPERAIDPRMHLARVVEGVDPGTTRALGIEAGWLGRRAGELSGGQLQRLNIARALQAPTRYLIADEITTMLDGLSQAELWRTLVTEARARDLGVLVISHDIDLLGHVADRVVGVDELRADLQ